MDRLRAKMPEAELDKIIAKYLKACKEGDLKAIMDLADRLDGKPKQTVDNTHRGSVPVQVVDPGDFDDE